MTRNKMDIALQDSVRFIEVNHFNFPFLFYVCINRNHGKFFYYSKNSFSIILFFVHSFIHLNQFVLFQQSTFCFFFFSFCALSFINILFYFHTYTSIRGEILIEHFKISLKRTKNKNKLKQVQSNFGQHFTDFFRFIIINSLLGCDLIFYQRH